MSKFLVWTSLIPDELDDHDGQAEYEAKISDVFRPKPFDYLIQGPILQNSITAENFSIKFHP
jgi:hypothetical protein